VLTAGVRYGEHTHVRGRKFEAVFAVADPHCRSRLLDADFLTLTGQEDEMVQGVTGRARGSFEVTKVDDEAVGEKVALHNYRAMVVVAVERLPSAGHGHEVGAAKLEILLVDLDAVVLQRFPPSTGITSVGFIIPRPSGSLGWSVTALRRSGDAMPRQHTADYRLILARDLPW